MIVLFVLLKEAPWHRSDAPAAKAKLAAQKRMPAKRQRSMSEDNQSKTESRMVDPEAEEA